MPQSWVGGRKVKPAPVPTATARQYFDYMMALWQLPAATDEVGVLIAHPLRFSPDADRLMEEFETWLEPQLGEGQDLSLLGGWANKLAGAVARIAASLHLAEHVACGQAQWEDVIDAATVEAAIRLGRRYFLPHAMGAFAVMGADEQVEDAHHVWSSICRRSVSHVSSNQALIRVSRRDLHNWNQKRFPTVTQLDSVLNILVKEGYIRLVSDSGQIGRGNKSPLYAINPLALAANSREAPGIHGIHGIQLGDAWEGEPS
jgi:hypothetical protein